LVTKENQMICQKISRISPYIRFVGVIGNKGDLLSDLERLRGPMQKIENKILSLAKAKHPGKVVKLNTG